ncbi:MAG: alpha/beta hydrolase [Acidimicrobiia bacterium]|jgi:pimeloyl-ACP methyl ester carboxylesterase|nr:alpha/beta hydrolase [Acidimicrobiia bacterium]MBP8179823.1 alpha/beta hydrolase [Acidimicrobiia bacterium]
MSRPNPPFNEGFVELSDGRRLAFSEFGDPDGEVTFWLHGTPGGRRQVPPGAVRTAERKGMRIIGVGRPGVNGSDVHHYDSVADFALDLMQVANSLGIESFNVIGLSGGGPYALAAASRLPERVKAVAVLGGLGPTKGPDRAGGYTDLLGHFSPIMPLVRPVLGCALAHGIRPLIPVASEVFDIYTRLGSEADRDTFQDPDIKAMLIDDLVRALRSGLRAPALDLTLFSRDWGFRLGDINVPVRFWHGDADSIVPHGHGISQASLVPNADLITVPGGGHMVGYLVADDVLDFVNHAGVRATQR